MDEDVTDIQGGALFDPLAHVDCTGVFGKGS